RFVVNTPAATAPRSATMSATSGPAVFRPQRTPAKRNPGTTTRWARRASFTRPASRRLAVTLLVFLPAAARAGIVAPELVAFATARLHLRRLGRRLGRRRMREPHAGLRATPALLLGDELRRQLGPRCGPPAGACGCRLPGLDGALRRHVDLDAPEL